MTNRIRILILSGVAAMFALPFGSAIALSGGTSAPAPNPRICFPAKSWDAPDGLRPCVHVRVFEDGSYRAKVRHANGTLHPTP